VKEVGERVGSEFGGVFLENLDFVRFETNKSI
jgi:hypothetical protein